MSTEPLFLLGTIIALAFVGNAIFERFRLPDAVLLSVAGFVLGRLFGFESILTIKPYMSAIGTVALAIVLLEAGLELDLRKAYKQAGRAIILALLSFAAAACLGYFALSIGLGFSGWTAWGISAALACTSARIAIPALRKVLPGTATASLLAMESAISESLAVVIALAMLGMAANEGPDTDFWTQLGSSLLIGAGVGLAVGGAWLGMLRRLARKRFVYLLTIGLVFLLMATVELLHGSGAIAVLVFGMTVANGEAVLAALFPSFRGSLAPRAGTGDARSEITDPHAQIFFFIRGFLFLYLGLLFTWPGGDLRLWLGILVAVVAAIAAREFAVSFAGWVTRLPGRDRAVLRVSSARGLTTLALLAILAPLAPEGPWVTVAVSVVIASNLRLSIGAAKLAREATSAGRPG